MEVLGLARSLIDHLRGQIVLGKLAPGEKINEIQIASELDISRSPLREALRILENERLVSNIPRKGSFVTDISLEDLNEIYQMREMIELYALQLLEINQTKELPDLMKYADNTKNIIVPTENDSPEEKMSYINSLAQYHLKLVESAGNKRLFEFYKMIHSNINRYVYLNAFIQGVAEHRVEEHNRILKFIGMGKYDSAKKMLRDHIRFAGDQLKTRVAKSTLNHTS